MSNCVEMEWMLQFSYMLCSAIESVPIIHRIPTVTTCSTIQAISDNTGLKYQSDALFIICICLRM